MELPLLEGSSEKQISWVKSVICSAARFPAEKNSDETTIFDATGLYILDLAAAKAAIAKAKKVHMGIEVEM